MKGDGDRAAPPDHGSARGDGKRRANRLIDAVSPYLRQHAYNPVDWFPWGPEGLARAKAEDKPILLSIGYSACHWCHVMEKECFENAEIAELMNRYFINIKVDREERPDLDHIYQLSAQLLSGEGGWPLTVFLTPDLRPFYAGTYFPPVDRYGRPGFPRLLRTLHQLFTEQRERIEEAAAELAEHLRQVNEVPIKGTAVRPTSALEEAADRLLQQADRMHGGFGKAPKFPTPNALEFLLRAWQRTGRNEFRDHVLHSLRQMALGGLYDQLGGGFHRYSVDAQWCVPHFEKMLYDNALLVPLYVDAFRISGDSFFRRIAVETLAYVQREMTHPEGGFFTAQDADSEGEEGKFFVWTPAEVRAAVGEDAAPIICDYYGVTDRGNFEHGTTVLRVAAEPARLAAKYRMPVERVEGIVTDARRRLFEYRERRVKPFRDEKILSGWNGLMISAFARAAQGLGDDRYRIVAQRALAFVERHLIDGGRLLRAFKDRPGEQPAFAEDYVFLAQALIDMYEGEFDTSYLRRAETLMSQALDAFWDDESGGFFQTPRDGEPLLQRPKEAWDQSVPSANGAGALTMLRLYRFTGEHRWRDRAEAILRLYGPQMVRHPLGFGSMLTALDFWHGPVNEVVVAARPGAKAGDELLAHIRRWYAPNQVLAWTDGRQDYPALVAGKVPPEDGGAAVYVCRNFRCERPVSSWEELEPLLR